LEGEGGEPVLPDSIDLLLDEQALGVQSLQRCDLSGCLVSTW
jgi:hypothetical protein